MDKLFIVEMYDTTLEIAIRAGKYEEILEEAEQCAIEAGKHSVKVYPIEEVDGYRISVTKI